MEVQTVLVIRRQFCYDCSKKGLKRKECMIPQQSFYDHQMQKHIPGIKLDILYMMHSMEERMTHILFQDKRAQSSPARALELYGRFFPFKNNANWRIIYNSIKDTIEQPAELPYDIWDDWIRHIESALRAERAVRLKFPQVNGSDRTRIHRAAKFNLSKEKYGDDKAEREGVPNTYVEMS